jgi:hypothetical protein
MVLLEIAVENKVPAKIFSVDFPFSTAISREPRGSYFIAHISTGSLFVLQLILEIYCCPWE